MNTNQKTEYDLVIHNIRLATMAPKKDGTLDYGIREKAVIAVKDGKISAIFDESESLQLTTEQSFDGQGKWLLPGLIDCHTHLVYGGNRVNEFELRLNGASYQQIAEQGGGIRSTVQATRAADFEALFDSAAKRLSFFIDEGVTTVEIKSGYGLNLETEMKMLKVAQSLDQHAPVTVSKTFLGAHTVPAEYDNNADGYIDDICDNQMPILAEAGLIDCVDAFCENIGFNLKQTEKVFDKAKTLGLPVKLHAEQLSNLGGSKLAAQHDALSVDHLEFLSEEDVSAIKESGTVATLLPGAYYFLRETQLPPIETLRQQGVPIAIASDSNPGSSPTYSLLLMLNMAATQFKLTPLECLSGVTINSAKALGMAASKGSIEKGKEADFALFDIEHPAELSYRIAGNPCVAVIKAGEIVINRLAEK